MALREEEGEPGALHGSSLIPQSSGLTERILGVGCEESTNSQPPACSLYGSLRAGEPQLTGTSK